MNIKNCEKDKIKVKIKTYPKYDDYNYPVILLDSDLDIIYKNNAARFVNIKPRIGMNIKKYTDAVNLEILRNTFNNRKVSAVKLNVQSNVKYCTARIEKVEKCDGFEGKSVLALVFVDSLNFLRDDSEAIDKINNVIAKYNEQESKISGSAGVNNLDALRESRHTYSEEFAVETGFDKYPAYHSHEGNKKILRVRDHFRRHIVNLKTNMSETDKNYCDIGMFMRNFEAGITPCINNLGYKINFDAEDKMFMYKINERDFLTVNFILASFALEHSVFDKINVKFFTDINMVGVLRYEFSVTGDFGITHKDMFKRDYIEDIGSIEYLDLALVMLIAKNNDLQLSVKFNDDNGSKVYIDLIFASKIEMFSAHLPYEESFIGIITVDFIRDISEIEFSGIIGFKDKKDKRVIIR